MLAQRIGEEGVMRGVVILIVDIKSINNYLLPEWPDVQRLTTSAEKIPQRLREVYGLSVGDESSVREVAAKANEDLFAELLGRQRFARRVWDSPAGRELPPVERCLVESRRGRS